MFDDLPPDLDRLHTLRVWHTLWLQRIDAKIAALTRHQAEKERGRRSRPAPPEWIVELGIGERRPPLQVHAGDCYLAGTRRRPVDRDEARRLLANGLIACGHCRPDSTLGITALSNRPSPTAAAAHGSNTPTHPVDILHSRRYAINRPGKDRAHDHPSPTDHRARPLRPHLPRRQGRPAPHADATPTATVSQATPCAHGA